jgi:hypothetical protein
MLKSMCTIIKAGGNKHTPYRHQILYDADLSTNDERRWESETRFGEKKEPHDKALCKIATFNKLPSKTLTKKLVHSSLGRSDQSFFSHQHWNRIQSKNGQVPKIYIFMKYMYTNKLVETQVWDRPCSWQNESFSRYMESFSGYLVFAARIWARQRMAILAFPT